MNDTNPLTEPENEPENERKTLGQTLADARHACQLSQLDIAAKLCLAVGVIQDIENDRIDSKINPLFSKGYINNYAKLVNADRELILKLFEQQYQSCSDSNKMQSFSQRKKTQIHNRYLNGVTVLILLGFTAMIIAWWWQRGVADLGSTPGPAQSQVKSSVNIESADLDAIVPILTPVLQTDANANTQTNTNTQTSTQTSTMAEPSALVGTADEQAQGVIKHTLEFKFSKDCWVKVTDASNEVLAIGIKKAGRLMQINGVAPFEVTLGAPAAVSINYQAKPLDITPFITGKTARFSVPLE